MGFPDGSTSKESTCLLRRHEFNPCVRKILWSRKWQPTPIILAGKFHRQRILAGCSPGGHKESDMTEPTHFMFHVQLGCVSIIPSFIEAPLGCFYLLAVVNNAPVNMDVQISLWDPAFNLGWYIPRSWIGGSHGSCIFHCGGTHHTVSTAVAPSWVPTSSVPGL